MFQGGSDPFFLIASEADGCYRVMGGEGFTIANALNEAGIQIHTLPSYIPNLSSKKTKKNCVVGGEGFTIANALDEAGIQIHTLPSYIPIPNLFI